ncbi:MAG: hypothetical protein HYX96_06825, partial [Chloroflexi bacterium]|nr:hypothetical protein [Chloroflexota bacterium]
AKPVVRIETINGYTISCNAEVEIVKILAQKLYSKVGVSGNAQWEPKTLMIRQFTINNVLPYAEVPLDEAFRELAAIAGRYYADIDNVDEYIKHLRQDTESE